MGHVVSEFSTHIVSDSRISNRTTVQGDWNKYIGNVINSNNRTINLGVNEEAWRIQEWLSPLEPHIKPKGVRNKRVSGVGDWVLGSHEFELWSKGQKGAVNPALLCYGNLGVGKTYISSLAIDTLRDRTLGQNMAVLGIYCDHDAQKEQSAVNLIGGLLRQAVWEPGGIRGEIQKAFTKSKMRGGQGLHLQDMLKLFVQVIGSIDRVYICVDALDELLPTVRIELLQALRQIIRDTPDARLFLTTRPYIRGELGRYLVKDPHTIKIVANQGEIAIYLNHMMDNDRDPDLMTEDLREVIIETILCKASEMFLFVALSIDAILGETSKARRKKMLQNVATTGVELDTVYAPTLQRLRDQKGHRSKLGMEVLMWVSHSERPLRIEELGHALAVDVEVTDLDVENLTPEKIILESSLGLVVVDKRTSRLRLIHPTLQGYLSCPGALPDAHETLAETCLAYLNYEQVKRLPTYKVPNPRDMPFLEYSSLYWGSHAKRGLSDRANELALKLLTRYDRHISATSLFNQMQSDDSPPVIDHLFSGLHCASYFGIFKVVAALIEMEGCDANQSDCKGFTPLMWAARMGNEAVVKLLLTRNDVNPDKADNKGTTPLWEASRYGHEKVVRLLLARGGVNPNKPNNDGVTPLQCASSNGHEGVVSLLSPRGAINPDQSDNKSTQLPRASSNRQEGVVRPPVAQDEVNLDEPDSCDQPSLQRASSNRHEEMVTPPVVRDDVNPDQPENRDQMPPRISSMRRYRRVVAEYIPWLWGKKNKGQQRL